MCGCQQPNASFGCNLIRRIAGLSHNASEENPDYRFGNIWDRKDPLSVSVSIFYSCCLIQLVSLKERPGIDSIGLFCYACAAIAFVLCLTLKHIALRSLLADVLLGHQLLVGLVF